MSIVDNGLWTMEGDGVKRNMEQEYRKVMWNRTSYRLTEEMID